MAIPDYQTSMLPFLHCLADGREHALAQIRESLAAHFSLADEELEELLPSGSPTIFEYDALWVSEIGPTEIAPALRGRGREP